MPDTDKISTLCTAIAEELRHVRGHIEQLAEVLVGDEQFAANHIDRLQVFDFVIQHADESADLLARVAGGEDVQVAVGRVRLGEMQGRLRAAVAGD